MAETGLKYLKKLFLTQPFGIKIGKIKDLMGFYSLFLKNYMSGKQSYVVHLNGL